MTVFFASTWFASTHASVDPPGGCLAGKGPKSLGPPPLVLRLTLGLGLLALGAGSLAPGAMAQASSVPGAAMESPLPAPPAEARARGQGEEAFELERLGSPGLELEVNPGAIAEPGAQPAVSSPPVTQPPASVAPEQQRVYLADNQVSFEPPRGFTAMGRDEIAQKFPGTMPPQYAYANAGREVSVGISISDIELATEQLPEARQFLADFLESSVPGFQWIENDFVNIAGQDWIKLEFLSQDNGRQVHNDLYITSLDGRLLGFNFNALLALNDQLRPLLEDSRNSIQLELKPAGAADALPEPEAALGQ